MGGVEGRHSPLRGQKGGLKGFRGDMRGKSIADPNFTSRLSCCLHLPVAVSLVFPLFRLFPCCPFLHSVSPFAPFLHSVSPVSLTASHFPSFPRFPVPLPVSPSVSFPVSQFRFPPPLSPFLFQFSFPGLRHSPFSLPFPLSSSVSPFSFPFPVAVPLCAVRPFLRLSPFRRPLSVPAVRLSVPSSLLFLPCLSFSSLSLACPSLQADPFIDRPCLWDGRGRLSFGAWWRKGACFRRRGELSGRRLWRRGICFLFSAPCDGMPEMERRRGSWGSVVGSRSGRPVSRFDGFPRVFCPFPVLSSPSPVRPGPFPSRSPSALARSPSASPRLPLSTSLSVAFPSADGACGRRMRTMHGGIAP